MCLIASRNANKKSAVVNCISGLLFTTSSTELASIMSLVVATAVAGPLDSSSAFFSFNLKATAAAALIFCISSFIIFTSAAIVFVVNNNCKLAIFELE